MDLLGLIAAQLCYGSHVAVSDSAAVIELIKEHGEPSWTLA